MSVILVRISNYLKWFTELYMQRCVICPKVEIAIEKRMKSGTELKYQYSTFNVQSQILTGFHCIKFEKVIKLLYIGGTLQWESSTLFQNQNIPPIILGDTFNTCVLILMIKIISRLPITIKNSRQIWTMFDKGSLTIENNLKDFHKQL